jgi:hypothetical protein
MYSGHLHITYTSLTHHLQINYAVIWGWARATWHVVPHKPPPVLIGVDLGELTQGSIGDGGLI